MLFQMFCFLQKLKTETFRLVTFGKIPWEFLDGAYLCFKFVNGLSHELQPYFVAPEVGFSSSKGLQ